MKASMAVDIQRMKDEIVNTLNPTGHIETSFTDENEWSNV